MKQRKICVFTGSRAEYGILQPLIRKIDEDTKLSLMLLVSGMHLSKKYGSTYKEIKDDGFKINKLVNMDLSSDDPVKLTRSMGIGIRKMAEALDELKPDIVLILGDRYEAFSLGASAMMLRLPIAHISGGDVTYGLIDEAIRHSLTKMSHLHFTSTEVYRKRVIQLGESPNRVFNVGALGLDNIKNLDLLSKNELEKSMRFVFKKHNFLVTFHPVTLNKGNAASDFKEVLKAVDSFEDTGLIFTAANSDTGGALINKEVKKYVRNNKGKSIFVKSLGVLRYLSLLQFVDVVIGNSSSGLVEVPSFMIGTINIGDRQAGRIKASSVIDCVPEKNILLKAIRKSMSSRFTAKIKNQSNPYGDGNTALKIKNILKTYPLTDDLLKKEFYDIL